ncbi:O-methyltransferase [Lunatibacter salilacus]|uniref:O-methyltransferase n=1 Tax=Lunatibacter salilacus TaxID=2483804 RepID=UPI00131E875E|nr:class I SAM-dependent methyltransferase [Lunatibacter salilacus]
MTIRQLTASIYIAKEYLLYFLERTDHHSLQAPFASTFYRELMVYIRQHREGNPSLEKSRKTLAQDTRILDIKDEGAGSNFSVGSKRSVFSICKYACSALSYNLLYQFIVMRTPAETVVELGTSLGINTGYLATRTKGTVYTFEADCSLLKIAKHNLNTFPNVTFIQGNINQTFPDFLCDQPRIDFIQLDAHHTYRATMQYCKWVWPYLHEKSVVVIGDIHWSAEMKKAWTELKKFPGVTSTMDFFECGVLFFRTGIQPEHHILYYPAD